MGMAKSTGNVQTGHAGHNHIGDQHVDAAWTRTSDGERFGAICREQELVSAPQQHACEHGADLGIIFDGEHRLAAATRRDRSRCWLVRNWPLGARQEHQHAGPHPELALDVDAATALLHDAEHSCEPEPSPLAARLGCEEWLEDAAEVLGRNALASALCVWSPRMRWPP